MSDTTDFLLGMVIGGVLGFAAGLMVAPESGDETRQKLREQARIVADDFRDGAGEFTVKLKDGAEEVMRRASSHIPSADDLDDKLGSVQRKLEELEEQLDSKP